MTITLIECDECSNPAVVSVSCVTLSDGYVIDGKSLCYDCARYLGFSLGRRAEYIPVAREKRKP